MRMHGTGTYVNRSFSDTLADGFYRFIHSSFRFQVHRCEYAKMRFRLSHSQKPQCLSIFSGSTLFVLLRYECRCCCCRCCGCFLSPAWNSVGSCQMHSIESMTGCLFTASRGHFQCKLQRISLFLIYVIEKQNFVFINFIFTTAARPNNKT